MPDTRARTVVKAAEITPDAAAECLWLWRRGVSVRELTSLMGSSRTAVAAAMKRALRAEGSGPATAPFRLVLIWGGSAKAKPTCADIHPRGPIPVGSKLCCFACDKSGMDGHPSLQREPAPVVCDAPA